MYEQTFSVKDMMSVYRLVQSLQQIDCDMDLMTDHRRSIVDAKSILGVCSLDLSRPLTLKAYTNDSRIVNQLKAVLSEC